MENADWYAASLKESDPFSDLASSTRNGKWIGSASPRNGWVTIVSLMHWPEAERLLSAEDRMRSNRLVDRSP